MYTAIYCSSSSWIHSVASHNGSYCDWCVHYINPFMFFRDLNPRVCKPSSTPLKLTTHVTNVSYHVTNM